MVVAEELHFSKAAARVHLAQQALSREIKELEHHLGAKLLERTTRTVALTPAGEIFLAGARAALATLDAATAEVQRTVRGLTGTLRLGYVPGAALELTPLIVAEFQQQHPDVVVEMQEFPISDPSCGLASRDVDVAFLRLPQDAANIETEVLAVDPVVAMVSTTHRHAERDSVAVHDLIGDPITVSTTGDEAFRAFWCLGAARDESTPASVVPVNSITEEAQLVAAGKAVAVTSAALMDYLPVPGIRFLPIQDWPGSALAVGWNAGESGPLAARFVEVACSVRNREIEIVHKIENRSTGS